MNKTQPATLSGCIMDLAAQNDYMPLEIMTDRAKRSYFTRTFSSLWGYRTTCVSVGERGRASQACRPRSALPGCQGAECQANAPSDTRSTWGQVTKASEAIPRIPGKFASEDMPAESLHVTFCSHKPTGGEEETGQHSDWCQQL